MCTAVTFTAGDMYFGRTLDYTCSYGEEVVVAPRGFLFEFGHGGRIERHYAIIGMAYVTEGYPLFYDGVNEKGLAMAGLNFVGYAEYGRAVGGRDNIAQFEVIPWVLAQCADVAEARALIGRLNIVDTSFSDELSAAQLHWMIADRTGAVVVEVTRDGLNVYDDPAGVMTNNPEFPWHMRNMSRFMQLSPLPPRNGFGGDIEFEMYSNGLGAVGLPGDYSSPSRFVRAAFVRANSVCGETEKEAVSRFFHIMAAVEQPKGCCITPEGGEMHTIYTSCCNADKGVYYYRTYDGQQTECMDMYAAGIDGNELVRHTVEY